MSPHYKKTWYEIAESYDEGGTMTVETFDTLQEAKKYVGSYVFTAESEVEFIFIDRWVEEDGVTRKDTSFKSLITKSINN